MDAADSGQFLLPFLVVMLSGDNASAKHNVPKFCWQFARLPLVSTAIKAIPLATRITEPFILPHIEMQVMTNLHPVAPYCLCDKQGAMVWRLFTAQPITQPCPKWLQDGDCNRHWFIAA